VSLDFLKGAEIDFIDEMAGASFRISNPNATFIMRMRHEFFDLILIQFGVVNPFSQRRHGALFKDNLQGNIHAEFLMNFSLIMIAESECPPSCVKFSCEDVGFTGRTSPQIVITCPSNDSNGSRLA